MGTDLQLSQNGRALKPFVPRRRETRSPRRMPRGRFAALGVILFDETEAEFEQFYRRVRGALGPKDALEELLVERVAICAWRLQRIYRIESGLFSKARVSAHNGVLKRTRAIELVFLRLTSQEDDLAKLTRYEASLERSVQRGLMDLNGHRAARRRGHFFTDAVGLERDLLGPNRIFIPDSV